MGETDNGMVQLVRLRPYEKFCLCLIMIVYEISAANMLVKGVKKLLEVGMYSSNSCWNYLNSLIHEDDYDGGLSVLLVYS